MNIFKHSYFYLALIVLTFSCGQPKSKAENKKADVKTKQVKADNTKNTKEGTKSLNSYWTAIKDQLKLTNKQIASLKRSKKKYAKLQKDVPLIKGKKDKAMVVELKKKERKEIKDIIGPKLYEQKLKIDKQFSKKGK